MLDLILALVLIKGGVNNKMFSFDSSSIVAGFIKQLLASFNLPKIHIYTREQQEYFDKNGTERADVLKTTFEKIVRDTNGQITEHELPKHFPYIKDGKLQELIQLPTKPAPEWMPIGGLADNQFVRYYDRGMPIPNLTKRLVINNNTYDSYTHIYLGEYLRFIRDFDGIDLMPLYNCFGNQVADNLSISVAGTVFDCLDSTFTIYKVPVKLFKKYTIALDADAIVELFCGIDTPDDYYTDAFTNLAEVTYKRIETRLCFAQPYLFDKLAIENLSHITDKDIANIAKRETELCLFIKVPKSVNSSIMVLEGDYLGWNDYTIGTGDSFTKYKNYTVIPDELITKDISINKVTALQLLRMNTGKQVPFAEKLIEYLVGNVITPTDDIMENTQRLLKVMKLNYDAISTFNAGLVPKPDVEFTGSNAATEKENYSDYIRSKQQDMNNYLRKVTSTSGIWTEGMKNILYRFMTEEQNQFETGHDILGYVDKDVEKYYTAPVVINDKPGRVSLMNIEMLEDE